MIHQAIKVCHQVLILLISLASVCALEKKCLAVLNLSQFWYGVQSSWSWGVWERGGVPSGKSLPFSSQIFPVEYDPMTVSTNKESKSVNFSWYSRTTSGGMGCSASLCPLKSWLWAECKCVLRPVADLNQ